VLQDACIPNGITKTTKPKKHMKSKNKINQTQINTNAEISPLRLALLAVQKITKSKTKTFYRKNK